MQVLLKNAPARYIRRLSGDTRDRIIEALEKLSHEPPKGVIANTGKSLVIETDLTAEEKAIVKAGRKAYTKDPASFITLEALKAELQQKSPKSLAKTVRN